MHKKFVSQSLRLSGAVLPGRVTVWETLPEDREPPWAPEEPDSRARERAGHPRAGAGRRTRQRRGRKDPVISASSHAERNGKSQDLKGDMVSPGNRDREWEIESERSGHKGHIDPREATGSTLRVLATIKGRKPEAVLRFLQERKEKAYRS